MKREAEEDHRHRTWVRVASTSRNDRRANGEAAMATESKASLSARALANIHTTTSGMDEEELAAIPTTLLVLVDRVRQFKAMALPGQPQAMHMGTATLVDDLIHELRTAMLEVAQLVKILGDNGLDH